MTKKEYIEEFLKKRGYGSKEEIRRFFGFEEKDLRKVAAMCGGACLLSELKEAVLRQKNIVIYGDYDADGIMASYILYSGLVRLIPDKVKIFINNRFEDGYSITAESLNKMTALYPDTDVIITCDNGIGAGKALSEVKKKGITVLVTDHHEQGEPMPEDIPAVDEKSIPQKEKDARDGIEREDFCGAELARRVISELYEQMGRAGQEKEFLDSLYAYSGFATITDSVQMNAANHYVARRGLKAIEEDRGFFEVLKNETGNNSYAADAITIGFIYGPLFNAAGRVSGTAKNALAAPVLFDMGYRAECAATVRGLIALNEKRKEMCRREDELAFSLIEENGWDKDPFILVAGDQFSEGINGLTASHIVSRYKVPAAVLSPVKNKPGTCKGSARSIEGFDLFRAFSSHSGKITAGGHPMAAGLSIKDEDIEEVRELLKADAKGVVYKEPEPDFIFTPSSLSLAEVENMREAFRTLEPFGPGLEAPRISIRGKVYPVRPLKEVHAKMTMQERSADGLYIDLLWWNHLKEAEKICGAGGEVMFMGELSINEYNGRRSIQFKVG